GEAVDELDHAVRNPEALEVLLKRALLNLERLERLEDERDVGVSIGRVLGHAARLTRLPRVRATVLTISTTIARGEGDDRSGPALVELCEQAGLETAHEVVSDDRDAIAQAISRHADGGARFVFTTGGTGMTADDVTPEATQDAIDRDAPGYAETIRQESRRHTPLGILTRGIS